MADTFKYNPFTRKLDIVGDGGGGGGTGTGYSAVVANFSALPDPTTVGGKFYYVTDPQGTPYTPDSEGGDYFPPGTYYSNGAIWVTGISPFQATQNDVNAGIITDQFVTPATLKNWIGANGGQTEIFTWKYQTNITPADPGNGFFRADNLTASLITQLFIDDITSDNQMDISALFGAVQGNWMIHIQQKNDATIWAQFTTSTPYTDNTGWWTVPVTFVQSSGGGGLVNSENCIFAFINKNGSQNLSLQGAYGNSSQPQITTTTPLGDFQVKRGSASDADFVLSIMNGAGIRTFGVTGEGIINGLSVKIFDTGTYKTALDSTVLNTLRFASEFTTLSILPTTINVTAPSPFIQSTGGGAFTIQNNVATQPIHLRTVGDTNSCSGIIMGLTTIATNATTTVRSIATITGTYQPNSGNAANFRGINIVNTINEGGSSTNTITLIDIQPTLSSVRGTIYGLRSRIPTPLPASPGPAGTGWNLFIDGTAPNFFGGTVQLQSSTVGNTLLQYTTVTGGTTNPVVVITQGRVLTTDNTVTTLRSFSTTTDLNYFIDVRVLARRTGGSAGNVGDSGIMTGTARVKNVGGVLTIMNSFADSSGADQAWVISWAISGTNILLQVTGSTNMNVTWILGEARIITGGG